jgi:cytochrome c-type biogenesis protein CcmH/NrfF
MIGARAAALMLGLALAIPARAAVPAGHATQQEIEEALTCQCGCGLTVHACNHLQCGSAGPMKKEIADKLAAGQTAGEILASFRARYGEKVLSAPTFRGFNWLAWITPFAAVLAGGLAMTVVIRRWVRAPQPPPPAAVHASDELRRRLARELADFEREG